MGRSLLCLQSAFAEDLNQPFQKLQNFLTFFFPAFSGARIPHSPSIFACAILSSMSSSAMRLKRDRGIKVICYSGRLFMEPGGKQPIPQHPDTGCGGIYWHGSIGWME